MNSILRADGVERHAESFYACSFAKTELGRRDWYTGLGFTACLVANKLDSSVAIDFEATGNQLRIVVRALGEAKAK